MLSRLGSKLQTTQQMLNQTNRGFRASVVANKKPSIGDAVTILQSKVSSINQVVSLHPFILDRVWSHILTCI